MATTIKNNLAALRTYNIMNFNNNKSQKSLLKVSSGMKITGAQDDAPAYAISERMRVKIRSLNQAHQNTQNGSNMLKTAEGAVSNILETLRTLKEKAVEAANDSHTDADRQILQKEFNQLIDQVDEDVLVQFNGMYLINNTRNNSKYITQSIFFNDKLSLDTTRNTKFMEMETRNGETLNIKQNDKILWSYVSNTDGTFHGELKGSNTLYDLRADVEDVVGYDDINRIEFTNNSPPASPYWQDKFGKIVHMDPGIIMESLLSTGDGFYAFSGFTFQVLNSDGSINKNATKALQFNELQCAESKTGDKALSFQLGAEANQATKVALTDMGTRSLGLKYYWYEELDVGTTAPGFLSIATKKDANAAIDTIDRAIKRVLDEQTNIGAFISRLDSNTATLNTYGENIQAAESTIRDTDMAKEVTTYTKYNILLHSSQAMLVQANQNSSDVLFLLSDQSDS